MISFIKREKIYVLMVIFILSVNLLPLIQPQPQSKELLGTKEKPLSIMTFEEAGITEEKAMDFFASRTPKAMFFNYLIIFGIFLFMLSIMFNVIAVFTRDKIRNFVSWPSSVGSVPWSIGDLIRAVIVIMCIGYVTAIIEAGIFKIFNLKLNVNLRMIITTFFVDISVLTVIVYFVISKNSSSLKALGLKLSGFVKNLLEGLKSYIFIWPSLVLVLFLSVGTLNAMGYTPPPQPVFEAFIEEKNSWILLFLAVFVSVLGPVVEEIFFRGFMYSALKKRLGMAGAAILTAGIFSALHANIFGFLPIMVLGLLLVYLYERTGSLTASMAVHIIHNSIIIAFVFFIKELI